MNPGFNLNIFNYNKPELEELLSLTAPYQNNDIETSCVKLSERLLKDQSKSQDEKVKIKGFLEQVKMRLITNYRPNPPEMPPRNQLLPPSASVDGSAMLPNEYKKVDFPPTFPSITPPKNLNPMEKRLLRKTLNIDSRFRDNYYKTEATDLQITLPTVIKKVITMKLVAFELSPCAIYTINKRYGNHFFHYSIVASPTDGVAGHWITIKISDGTYSGAEMVQAINNELDKQGHFPTIKAAINEESCRIYFIKQSVHFHLAFNRDLTGLAGENVNLQLKLGWILGFTLGRYTDSLEYLSEAPYDGVGSKYHYLVVDDFNNNVNNYFMAAFNNSILARNILARIPRYSVGNFSNAMVADDINDLATSTRNFFGPIDIAKLKIQLLDEYGRIVYINNRDFSMALEFECVYN